MRSIVLLSVLVAQANAFMAGAVAARPMALRPSASAMVMPDAEAVTSLVQNAALVLADTDAPTSLEGQFEELDLAAQLITLGVYGIVFVLIFDVLKALAKPLLQFGFVVAALELFGVIVP